MLTINVQNMNGDRVHMRRIVADGFAFDVFVRMCNEIEAQSDCNALVELLDGAVTVLAKESSPGSS
jgi:hypothetical protein